MNKKGLKIVIYLRHSLKNVFQSLKAIHSTQRMVEKPFSLRENIDHKAISVTSAFWSKRLNKQDIL